MDNLVKYFPFLFPVAFALLWLGLATLFGFMSGWYPLVRKYPNQREKEIVKFKYQSGLMGGVPMRGMLTISICPSGLRIGTIIVWKIFYRDFLVPWEEIRVKRKDGFFWQAAELKFGNPTVGELSISAKLANRLARSAVGHWPETVLPQEEPNDHIFASIVKKWAVRTFIVATFFIVTLRLFSRQEDSPPISILILFPAVVFGFVSLFRYIRVRNKP